MLGGLAFLFILFLLYTQVLAKEGGEEVPVGAVKEFVSVIYNLEEASKGCLMMTVKARQQLAAQLLATGSALSECEDVLPSVGLALADSGVNPDKTKFTTVYEADKSKATVYFKANRESHRIAVIKENGKWLVDGLTLPAVLTTPTPAP